MLRTMLALVLLMPVMLLSEINFRGEITGADGKAIKYSEVMVEIPGNKRKSVKAFPVDEQGKFNFKTEQKDFLRLIFTGYNHTKYVLELILADTDTLVDLKVRLAPYAKPERINDIYVVGDFNGFSFDEGKVPLEPQSDGTFTATVPKKNDTLYYQILGLINEPEQRSVNGTMGDFYENDGSGDYRTAVISKDTSAKIVFDPNKFFLEPSEASISTTTPSISEYLGDVENINKKSLEWQTKIRASYIEEDSAKTKKLMKDALKDIESYYSTVKNHGSKQITILEYFEIAYGADYMAFDDIISHKMADEGTKILSATSRIWEDYPMAPFLIYKYADKKVAEEFRANLLAAKHKGRFIDEFKSRSEALNFFRNYKDQNKIEELIKNAREPENALFFTIEMASGYNRPDIMRYFIKLLYEKYPDSWNAKMVRYTYDENKKIQVGKNAPKFSFKSLEDTTKVINNATFKGKYVLIDIWATWCGPCISEMGHLHQAFKDYHSDKFEMLSISFDNSIDDIKRFRQTTNWKMPWYHVFEPGQFTSSAGEIFEVTGIPRPVLIDPQGKIIALEGELRGTSLFKTLDKYLKK